MVIEKTTRAERLIVEAAMYDVMASVGIAYDVLQELWEDHFAVIRTHPVSEAEVNSMGNILLLCCDKLFDALLQYALTTGNGFSGVEPHMSSAKREAAVMAIEAAMSEIEAREKHMSEAVREVSQAERRRISELPDEEALPLLRAMLEGETT